MIYQKIASIFKSNLSYQGVLRELFSSSHVHRRSALALSGFALVLSQMIIPTSAYSISREGPSDSALIEEAYDYIYPSYALSIFRWNALNGKGGRTSTKLNEFVHQRAMTTPADTWAASPLVDCLYSTAWLDLSAGPVLIETPDTGSRYFVLTLIDYFSGTFKYVGSRNTGTAAQKHLVVGPDWTGSIPDGVQVVRSPTNDVYINLRVAIDGPDDQVAANATQDGFLLKQSGAGVSRRPPSIKPIPGDLENYFSIVNQAIAFNPAPDRDKEVMKRLRAVGICGEDCKWEKLSENVREAWRANFDKLTHQFDQILNRPLKGSPNWINYAPPGSKMGSPERKDFKMRAREISRGLAMLGLAPAEAAYSAAGYGTDGQALVGSKKYKLHIPAGGIPSNVFWSVTLYEFKNDSQFLTPNPINRHRVSSSTREFVRNADGSIDVWVQSTPPVGEKATNWLPSPANGERFWFIARSYGPKPEVLEGKFSLPHVEVIQ
ncbi:DUF1254 domain-containing protein [Comamonas thiooxydans]|uniref:DUF1254 domain-containing protein n=1 Tax=Comamonas thiooxydans TaxID=363952 RepID=UPI000B41B64B|nr:DUF1254 domain-containing protein [Comamonas thiooxydans]BDB69751.1 lipoprotein [Comamonas thiooxydans]